MNETVKAQSYWVWTYKAEKENPARSRAGETIWNHCKENAPKWMIEKGLIVDKSEFIKEGQTDIFDYL
ncbi:hypothetical protein J2Z32_003490 [Paenibacillus turicensis]|uniref:Uncharacterized protein n=1 Tax=Paenibacillus turicensis TaxID=160487 RepID=A0ABS4FW62_9BACL|nr:hypothetical protein [Paenibacillus turicensis]MBP1906826.1 hypothetical protein [Paenibacillus turicensis]